MAEPLLMLAQALELGRRELESLQSGDIDAAEKLAAERGGLILEAMDQGCPGRDEQTLLARLQELQALQGQLTARAEQARHDTKQELLRVRQEGRRLGGYKSGAVLETGIQSRFVSKHG